MGNADFAIVIGLDRYSNIAHLKGAERDAREFYNWLRDQDGGDVPDANIIPVFSSDPAFTTDSEPRFDQIAPKFFDLMDRVTNYVDTTANQVQRLYIFMAGHGLSWGYENTGLLSANADYGNNQSSCFAGDRIALEWFGKSGHCKEIALIMDCCRNFCSNATPYQFWGNSNQNGKPTNPHFYLGFAVKSGNYAREVVLPPGGTQQRGIFTYTFIQALRNAMPGPNGEVTGIVLNDYIVNEMPKYSSNIKADPHLEVRPTQSNIFVWARRPVGQKIAITLCITPAPVVDVELWDPALTNVLCVIPAATPFCKLPPLSAGMHMLKWTDGSHSVGLDVLKRAMDTATVNTLVTAGPEVTYA